jgi:hypothetical protein
MNEAQPAVAEIAALVGNPARANILMALIEGRALLLGSRRRAPA